MNNHVLTIENEIVNVDRKTKTMRNTRRANRRLGRRKLEIETRFLSRTTPRRRRKNERQTRSSSSRSFLRSHGFSRERTTTGTRAFSSRDWFPKTTSLTGDIRAKLFSFQMTFFVGRLEIKLEDEPRNRATILRCVESHSAEIYISTS